ncbi:MAG: hypothetical protein IT581_05475 [Verrucomicrobiales bacterium]|nr:hypothetical protein [Verrucomicrobiales bacterium]
MIASLMAALVAAAPASQAQLRILDILPDNQIRWDRGTNSGMLELQESRSIENPVWQPVWYSLDTNQVGQAELPTKASPNAYYRLQVGAPPSDPSLILHLPFENDFNSGVMLDASGRGNHALRYGRPCCPTNWPIPTVGVDGKRAAQFRWYEDDYGKYGRSGDYMGIPTISDFQNLTNATISVWLRYFATYTGSYTADQNSTILDTGHAERGTWSLGHLYGSTTKFAVGTNDLDTVTLANFPDRSEPDGDSKDWNHYLVTFEAGVVKAYYNGVCISTNTTDVTTLTVAGQYIGIGCWTFNKTPWMDLSEDLHPNNAWVNGLVDDIRIYNRVLSAEEASAVYSSFDRLPPVAPQKPSVTSLWSTGCQISWVPISDRYGVGHYEVYRNGVLISTNSSVSYTEDGLPPGSSQTYTIKAADTLGQVSESSEPLQVVLPNDGSQLSLVIDDLQATFVGTWGTSTFRPEFQGIAYRHDEKTGKGQKSATYRPNLPFAGNYEVFVWYPALSTYESAVPIEINHADGQKTVKVDQRSNGGKWNSLGTYSFAAGNQGTVVVQTKGTTAFVIADAFKFVRK